MRRFQSISWLLAQPTRATRLSKHSAWGVAMRRPCAQSSFFPSLPKSRGGIRVLHSGLDTLLEELERETRPEFTLHRLDLSAFSPSPLTPMYLMMYLFGHPTLVWTWLTARFRFYTMPLCSAQVYRMSLPFKHPRTDQAATEHARNGGRRLERGRLPFLPPVIVASGASLYEATAVP